MNQETIKRVLLDELTAVLSESAEILLDAIAKNHVAKFNRELTESDIALYRAFIEEVLVEASDEFVDEEIDITEPDAPIYLKEVKPGEQPEYVYVGGELMPINVSEGNSNSDVDATDDEKDMTSADDADDTDDTGDKTDSTDDSVPDASATPLDKDKDKDKDKDDKSKQSTMTENTNITKKSDMDLINDILARLNL